MHRHAAELLMPSSLRGACSPHWECRQVSSLIVLMNCMLFVWCAALMSTCFVWDCQACQKWPANQTVEGHPKITMGCVNCSGIENYIFLRKGFVPNRRRTQAWRLPCFVSTRTYAERPPSVSPPCVHQACTGSIACCFLSSLHFRGWVIVGGRIY